MSANRPNVELSCAPHRHGSKCASDREATRREHQSSTFADRGSFSSLVCFSKVTAALRGRSQPLLRKDLRSSHICLQTRPARIKSQGKRGACSHDQFESVASGAQSKYYRSLSSSCCMKTVVAETIEFA
ncbi:hypothetical protein CBOM_07543 [Ceraceosorus bombacis]|uniref:Uncharacterized protein n=1 Tax=Ceraceosorus bombacis TaxID=401625 RepID=A0A0P1BET4_9BASI|nr:hypothetical protein CBOM_07543 [Ceraceosorus bombacis]